jgi:phosphopentomutase
MKRALVIVLDSAGCGNAPDAAVYGDEGANTLGHLFERIPGFRLPNLARLGLYEILRTAELPFPLPSPPLLAGADFAPMTERSAGKDSTTGHWELAGCVVERPFDTFNSFPEDLVEEIGSTAGVNFIGNVSASGTEILEQLGEKHLRSGAPILYTSADSVLQIAAHEETFGLERLWRLCKTTREVLDQRGIRIGRVIARPFTGRHAGDFKRTANRHDYSLVPPETVLNRLQEAGVATIGVGKIGDLFAGQGLSESHPTGSNAEGMAIIGELWAEGRKEPHLIFVNLVDFDTLYGHRRDPEGYANCLREFDEWLGKFLPSIGEDLLLITADHGNDPYHAGTDHTREQVPLMAVNASRCLVDGGDFTQVAKLVSEYFGIADSLDFA